MRKKTRRQIRKRAVALMRRGGSAYQNEMLQAVVAERVRIWNAIFSNSSVQPWTEGSKTTHIIRIGEPRLRTILLPELPEDYRPNTDAAQVAAPEHKSLGSGGAGVIHELENLDERYLIGDRKT